MSKLQILVVEDDAPVRNLITTTLKANDYRYLITANGEGAVAEAASHNPDIILLDLGLPDIDGVEVIRRVRSWSNAPIIVISARSEDSDKIDALDAGADDFSAESEYFEIVTAPETFGTVREALEKAGYTLASAEIMRIPQTTVTLSTDEDLKNMNKLIEMLEDNDDVQNVYHNVEL